MPSSGGAEIIVMSPLRRVREASVVVIVDTFRAATTACHILRKEPSEYLVVADSTVARRLAAERRDAVLVGKPEIGSDQAYDVPNSPTRVDALDLAGRSVIHRTTAGTTGVLHADAPTVLLAGLVNATATARLVGGRPHQLVPMGHEGTTPSLEDDIAAAHIRACLEGVRFSLAPHIEALRSGPGRYFFAENQDEYPEADFDCCLAADAFDFAVRAEVFGDYARLSRA